MEDLIESWERLAKKYFERAESSAKGSWRDERLFASADTLQTCADQLRRHISQNGGASD